MQWWPTRWVVLTEARLTLIPVVLRSGIHQNQNAQNVRSLLEKFGDGNKLQRELNEDSEAMEVVLKCESGIPHPKREEVEIDRSGLITT